MSALPFSREISLNLEGLQSKRTNYSGEKLQRKISSKILSLLHIFMGWLNPRFLFPPGLFPVLETFRKSISEYLHTKNQDVTVLCIHDTPRGQGGCRHVKLHIIASGTHTWHLNTLTKL